MEPTTLQPTQSSSVPAARTPRWLLWTGLSLLIVGIVSNALLFFTVSNSTSGDEGLGTAVPFIDIGTKVSTFIGSVGIGLLLFALAIKFVHQRWVRIVIAFILAILALLSFFDSGVR